MQDFLVSGHRLEDGGGGGGGGLGTIGFGLGFGAGSSLRFGGLGGGVVRHRGAASVAGSTAVAVILEPPELDDAAAPPRVFDFAVVSMLSSYFINHNPASFALDNVFLHSSLRLLSFLKQKMSCSSLRIVSIALLYLLNILFSVSVLFSSFTVDASTPMSSVVARICLGLM